MLLLKTTKEYSGKRTQNDSYLSCTWQEGVSAFKNSDPREGVSAWCGQNPLSRLLAASWDLLGKILTFTRSIPPIIESSKEIIESHPLAYLALSAE